jgi:hypothetical protein
MRNPRTPPYQRPGLVLTKQGSISFLKKRNKKLLLAWFTRAIRLASTEASKSFLVLFFKKELLSSHLPRLASASLAIRTSGR